MKKTLLILSAIMAFSASLVYASTNPEMLNDDGRLILVNAETGEEIMALSDNDVINLAEYGPITIIAKPDQMTVGSVVFRINSKWARTENAAPYALAGDRRGNYTPWDVAPGTYTICAQSYSRKWKRGYSGWRDCVTIIVVDDGSCEEKTWYLDFDGDGFGVDGETMMACEQPDGYAAEGGDCDDINRSIFPGAPETPNDGIDQDCDGSDFVLAQPIESLVLVDAESDNDLLLLEDLNVVDIAVVGDQLNIRAVSDSPVGSVVFSVNSAEFSTDNMEPYALAGDSDGDYNAWEGLVVPGVYEVCATPYTGPDGTGEAGAPTCAAIAFINSGGLPGAMNPGEFGDMVTEFEAAVYPNPFRDQTSLRVASPTRQELHIEVFNLMGVRVLERAQHVNQGTNQLMLDLQSQPAGTYLVRIIDEQGNMKGNFRVAKQ